MGYMVHHAIIVTTDFADIDAAHRKASELLGDLVSGVVHSGVNDCRSFFIAPDGSKEGWNESDKGEEARHKFINWLAAQTYQDGGNPFRWVLVQYGDDSLVSAVLDSSDHRYRAWPHEVE